MNFADKNRHGRVNDYKNNTVYVKTMDLERENVKFCRISFPGVLNSSFVSCSCGV